ncbi:hypothetical protein AURANDRAFT_8346, partial [Aureococcus anophagefferens]
PWLPDEDERVRQLVEARGPKLWAKMAVEFNETLAKEDRRTQSQIRTRWRDHLDPSVNRDPFTDREIEIIRDAQRRMPNEWVLIAALLPGRIDTQVSDYWYQTIRK